MRPSSRGIPERVPLARLFKHHDRCQYVTRNTPIGSAECARGRVDRINDWKWKKIAEGRDPLIYVLAAYYEALQPAAIAAVPVLQMNYK